MPKPTHDQCREAILELYLRSLRSEVPNYGPQNDRAAIQRGPYGCSPDELATHFDCSTAAIRDIVTPKAKFSGREIAPELRGDIAYRAPQSGGYGRGTEPASFRPTESLLASRLALFFALTLET